MSSNARSALRRCAWRYRQQTGALAQTRLAYRPSANCERGVARGQKCAGYKRQPRCFTWYLNDTATGGGAVVGEHCLGTGEALRNRGGLFLKLQEEQVMPDIEPKLIDTY
jgi:hypothetical protein